MTMETNENKVGGLSFGDALEALKKGYRIARKGWGNPISFIYLSKGNFDGGLLGFDAGEQPDIENRSNIDGIRLGLFEAGDTGTVIRLPGISALTGNGVIHTAMSPSHADMLAEDWEILSDPE